MSRMAHLVETKAHRAEIEALKARITALEAKVEALLPEPAQPIESRRGPGRPRKEYANSTSPIA